MNPIARSARYSLQFAIVIVHFMVALVMFITVIVAPADALFAVAGRALAPVGAFVE